MALEINIRRCLHCGAVIPNRYREDRKYCPEKDGIKNKCKNAHHNIQTLNAYHELKGLNKMHQHNHKVLKKIIGQSESLIVSEDTLFNAGLNWGFAIEPVEMNISKNKAHLFIGFGIEFIGNNKYKIFKHGKQFQNFADIW